MDGVWLNFGRFVHTSDCILTTGIPYILFFVKTLEVRRLKKIWNKQNAVRYKIKAYCIQRSQSVLIGMPISNFH